MIPPHDQPKLDRGLAHFLFTSDEVLKPLSLLPETPPDNFTPQKHHLSLVAGLESPSQI